MLERVFSEDPKRVAQKQLCSRMDTNGDPSTCFLVKYVASFMVTGDDQEKRLNCVHVHLEAMRKASHINKPVSLDASTLAQLRFFQRTLHNSKPVLLDASPSGIRVRSADGQTAHMAHALKRISYATCDPDSCQFAFSARQPSTASDAGDSSKTPPSSHPLPGVLYCHVFLTDSPQQAKEINDYVSDIFREAERRPRERQDTVYYEFSKNLFNSDERPYLHPPTFPPPPAPTMAMALNGNGVNARDEKVDELLERRREEKRFSDLCQILVHEQGHCRTIQYAKESSPMSELSVDTTSEHKYYAAHEILPPSVSIFKKPDTPISDPSPRQLRRSRFLGSASLDQPTADMGAPSRYDHHEADIFSDLAGLGCSAENGVAKEAPLRPESKRQKRRPLSAVLTDFAGAGKRRTSTATLANEDRTAENMRRISMLDDVLESNKNGANKNGSILKRLLHLKIGSGSSLRLNLLNESSSSGKTDKSNGHLNNRQRSSQSVRFLGASLDQGDDATSPSNGPILPVASKRRRRPLSAVFGNAAMPVPNGHNGIGSSHPAMSNGISHGLGNGFVSTPVDAPDGLKKMGTARSAMSKMFGFSSSRRKSRSSAHLDTATRRQLTLSTDLDISGSIPDERDSAMRRLTQLQPPSVDDVRHWQQQQSVHCLDEMTPSTMANGESPLLGSGVGCGEQCSISMPNLRYGLEQSLPLTLEEEMKLNGAAWFYGTVSRQLAAHVLETEPDGAFIVRRSVSQPMSSLVLSVRVPCSHNPSGVSHYLIIHTAKGFKLKGFTKDFPSVHALVTHHSFMAEQLPCRLVFTDRETHEPCFNRSLFNASSCRSMSNVILNDHHYQAHQKRSSQSRHSSPFVNKRHDLVPVTEEESVYGKLPSPPPPPPDQASSTLFAALKIADAKVF